MNYITVLLVSIALGIDAFSVAVSIGLGGANKKQMLTVTAIVTLFHVIMPLLGLYLGTYLGKIAGPTASSIGALVLIAIGLSILWKSLKELGYISQPKNKGLATQDKRSILSINSPLSLILLGASVSLDALTVGFGLGALKVDLFLTVITMGIIAGLMTLIGLVFGKKLNRTLGEKAEILGGLILVVIGVKLLFV
ncbi:MAG: hypothetical protein CVU87_03300 [Firmicutes bacterium HGW-Firmicutes-12]|nr:MAG: hypothetical protein CVU87_03300 [Firmicutes bacterium HGW-Firmicutes-12]